MALELLGGLVAEELHGIASLEQRDALGGQAFELDRSHLRAVPFTLALVL